MTLVDYIKKNRIAVGGLLFIALIVLIVVMLLSPGGEEQPESDRTTSSSSGIAAPKTKAWPVCYSKATRTSDTI